MLFLAALLVLPIAAFGTEIVAHRGASYSAPENTLPAVLLGWESGADAVEIDIHRTLDGRIVAIHDKDTKRITGQEGLVAQLSLAHLQLLDAGAWKGPQWRKTRIPTIEQVLSTVPPGRTLVIEIKCPIGVLPELERVLDASGKRDQVMLIAFDYETIAEAKRRMPELRSCWLYGFSGTEAARYKIAGPESLLERVGEAGLDGLDVKHDGPWVEDLSRSLAALGKVLYVYTVNDPGKARWLRDIGVTGITTDRPGFLREALAGE